MPRSVRNWLRSPIRALEWISGEVRFLLGSVQVVNLGPDRRIVCHPHACKVYTRSQDGDPEQRAEYGNFLLYCGPEMFLFDIGAHFGIFSLAAAVWGGKAVAIDASPMATKMIARQVKLNNLGRRIRVVQKTVSEYAGSMEMLSSGVFSDGYFKVAKGRIKRDLTLTEATTLDEMTEEFGAPTHIKIDVEGHELAVLQGGRRTLQEHSPILFLELHNAMIRADGDEPRSVLNLLYAQKYRIFSTSAQELECHEILTPRITRVVAAKL